MTKIIEWFDQHNINTVSAIGTVAILLLASIIIPLQSRFLKRWLIYLQSRLNLTDKTKFIINRVITAALWTLTVFIVLNVWGIGFGGVWAVLGSRLIKSTIQERRQGRQRRGNCAPGGRSGLRCA
jgi:small-conductance mechanosensitive channel